MMADLEPARSIWSWYRLTRERSSFFAELSKLDSASLISAVRMDIGRPRRNRLRTRAELEKLSRAKLPDLHVLRDRQPVEQTLQWMFLHRGYLANRQERVLAREIPTSCWDEKADGRSDLLAFDEAANEAVIVELKCASATDPLTRCVLEALWHWTFAMQHAESFTGLLSEFGCNTAAAPRLVISAPAKFFSNLRAQSRRRGGDEYGIALSWIDALRAEHVVDLRLLAIADDWQASGPDFRVSDWRG